MIVIIYVKMLTNMTDKAGGDAEKKEGGDCDPDSAGHTANRNLPADAD